MGFSRPGTKDGLGTFRTPFSAHRYKDIQMELSHVTLAQRAALGFVHRNLAQFGGKVVPILAVHDEIVLLAPVDEADVAARVLEESMTEAALSVLPDLPSKGLVEAKVAATWADKN